MSDLRIVSLLGSATEMVFELGLGDRLVGISHECDFPPAALGLPRVSRPRFDAAGLGSGEIDAAVRRIMEEHGSVYEVDVDLLRRLRPDILLTQAVCAVCAVPTGSVEAAVREIGGEAEVVSLDAHDLAGILATIEQVARAAGEPDRGREMAAALRARMDRVQAAVAAEPKPRVMMLEWLDPPFAPGHWVPEMVSLAGGVDLVGKAGQRSDQISWRDLAGMDPDVLLIEPCGFDIQAAEADAILHQSELRAIAPGAMARGEAWLLHSAWFSRSGPRVVEGIETLGAILHPSRIVAGPSGQIARRLDVPAFT